MDGFYWSANYRRDERLSLKAFFEDYEGMRPRVGMGVNLRPSKRAAFDLYDLAERMVRERLRRLHPGAGEEEIERGVVEWLSRRPGAEEGAASGPGFVPSKRFS